jgi:hypothetical protein
MSWTCRPFTLAMARQATMRRWFSDDRRNSKFAEDDSFLGYSAVQSGWNRPMFKLSPSGRWRLHGAISKKAVIFILAAVRTWNLSQFIIRVMTFSRWWMSMLVFLVISPCGPLGGYQRFGGTYRLHFQGWSGLFIYGLLNKDVSNSDCRVSNGKTIREWKEYGRKRSWPNLRYHPTTYSMTSDTLVST